MTLLMIHMSLAAALLIALVSLPLLWQTLVRPRGKVLNMRSDITGITEERLRQVCAKPWESSCT